MNVTTRNAAFQEWAALATNRTKRHRSRSFLIQGVHPLDVAVARNWPIQALLHTTGPRSRWAEALLASPVPGQRIQLAPELLAELGGKEDGVPEVVGVGAIPDDDLGRLGKEPGLVVIADRPSNPGNLGSLIRSADAFGADGVVVTGHAVDPYEPMVVRASRGSLFAVPTVRASSPDDVLRWSGGLRTPLCVVGTGEDGSVLLWDHDFLPPTAVVVGNEAAGMSRRWMDACTAHVRIPMVGAASSLNAAVAGSLVLYEADRQRRCSAGGQ